LPKYTLLGQVTDGLDTTAVAFDAAGHPDSAAPGAPPFEGITVGSITSEKIKNP